MDYVLAKETRDVFIKADLFKYLEKQTVKSNIFYFSTNNTADLWKLMSIINNNIDDHYTLAHNWTRRLLAMTKPEIILCEGKKAFDELITCLGGKPFEWVIPPPKKQPWPVTKLLDTGDAGASL